MARRVVNHLPDAIAVFFPGKHGRSTCPRDEQHQREIGTDHAFRGGDEHVRRDHSAHNVFLIVFLNTRVRVSDRIVRVITNRSVRLPRCASLSHHTLHSREEPSELIEDLLRGVEIRHALPNEKIRDVGKRPVVKRFFVLGWTQSRTRHRIRELLDQQNGIGETDLIGQ